MLMGINIPLWERNINIGTTNIGTRGVVALCINIRNI